MPPVPRPRIGPTIVLAVVWLALLALWLAIRPDASPTTPPPPAPAITLRR